MFLKDFYNHSRRNLFFDAIGEIAKVVFFGCLVFYFVLSIIEELSKGFVSNSFNLNILMIIIITSAFISIIFWRKKIPIVHIVTNENIVKTKKVNYLILAFFCISSLVITYLKFRTLGSLVWFLAIIMCLVVVLCSLIISKERYFHINE